MTETALLEEIKGLKNRIDEITKPKAGLDPQRVLGGFGGSPSPADIAGMKPMGWDGAQLILGKGNRQRLCGMGPALKMMAEEVLGKKSLAEQLEREHGFMTTERFATVGMKQKDGSIRKAALAEGAGVTGGYVIPPDFSANLLKLAIEQSFFRERATVLPMSTRTMQIPVLDQVTASGVAGQSNFLAGIFAKWQPEAATIAEKEPQFKMAELTAWDLVMVTIASNQMLQDNAIGLEAMLTQLFSEAIVFYSEYAFLQGLGAGSKMPLGILNSPAALSVTRAVANQVTYKDIVTMMSKFYMGSWKSGCWLAHQSVLPALLQMSDISTAPPGAAGQHLVMVNPYGTGIEGPAARPFPMSLLGLPLIFTEKLPALGTNGCLMLIDPSKYVIGDRLDLQIDTSPHVNFLSNQLTWRLWARMDGRPWLDGAITLADSVFQVSPFIYLTQ